MPKMRYRKKFYRDVEFFFVLAASRPKPILVARRKLKKSHRVGNFGYPRDLGVALLNADLTPYRNAVYYGGA